MPVAAKKCPYVQDSSDLSLVVLDDPHDCNAGPAINTNSNR